MKKLLILVLVLAFCIPASAELIVYKMTCRERAFDRAADCPVREGLAETMWLVLDVDLEKLELLECGEVEGLGGEVITDAAIFKTWRLGRDRFYDYGSVDDIDLYVLDGQVCVVTQSCGAMCVMFGNYNRRTLSGYCIIDQQYLGYGSCYARLDVLLLKKAAREGWTEIDDILNYLEDKQPKNAQQGEMCAPYLGAP